MREGERKGGVLTQYLRPGTGPHPSPGLTNSINKIQCHNNDSRHFIYSLISKQYAQVDSFKSWAVLCVRFYYSYTFYDKARRN